MRAPTLLACLLLATTAGCDRAPPAAIATTAPTQEAVVRSGDVSIRASVLPTAMLDERIARGYGITRSDRTVMLLVGLRRGPEGAEVAVPAQVLVKASDLRGRAHVIEMRELRSAGPGGLLDYVGTLAIDPPDTLRFDVQVTPEGGTASTMQFTREFHPR